jgi:hypothetical protein
MVEVIGQCNGKLSESLEFLRLLELQLTGA